MFIMVRSNLLGENARKQSDTLTHWHRARFALFAAAAAVCPSLSHTQNGVLIRKYGVYDGSAVADKSTAHCTYTA